MDRPRKSAAGCVSASTDPRRSFAADLRVESRSVRVDAAGRVTVEPQRCLVEQTLDYKIANEPLDRLLLEVPIGWDESIQPEATLDGQPAEWVRMSDDEINLGRRLQYAIALGERRVGARQLRLRFAVPREPASDQVADRINVPLIMPGDAELMGNRLSVFAGAGLSVQADDELWRRDDAASPQDGGLNLVAGTATPEVNLAIDASKQRSLEPTVVNRAWIQSWLGHSQRQDRAVYQFTTPSLG